MTALPILVGIGGHYARFQGTTAFEGV